MCFLDKTIAIIWQDIHTVLTSLNVSGVEVTKLNCQDSLNGGILLIVSGVVRSGNFSGKRRFTQAFFLAPQETGFYVLNDILQFNEEVLVNQHPVPEVPEIKVDSEIPASSPRFEHPGTDESGLFFYLCSVRGKLVIFLLSGCVGIIPSVWPVVNTVLSRLL